MKIRLDKRLEAILSLIGENERVADIGTDHGKIAVLAAEKTGCGVIATDISAQSLAKARRLAFERNCDNVEFRVGNGLEVVGAGEADTVVIAGIGGAEIIKILQSKKAEYSKYILVPHQNAVELRVYLLDNGYGILRDFALECGGRFYRFFVVCERSGEKNEYSDAERMFGRERTADFYKFRADRLKKLNSILPRVNGVKKNGIEKEIRILEDMEDES